MSRALIAAAPVLALDCMIRVLSALVLLPIVVGTVWLLPPVGTLVLAMIAAGVAFVEYAALAAALGVHVPRSISGVAVVGVCAALGSGWAIVDVVLMTALIGIGALGGWGGKGRTREPAKCGGRHLSNRLHRPSARRARGSPRVRRAGSGAADHGCNCHQ